jgi:two-component system chemotaxis sensor kinase CheA
MTANDRIQEDISEMDFDRSAILAAFLAESAEALHQVEHDLLELESNPADHELLHDIFRVAHTIKGNASALDLGALAGFAHVVEDLLEVLRNEESQITPALISLLLKATDALRVLVPEAVAGSAQLSPEQQELRKQIAHEVQQRSERVIKTEFTGSKATVGNSVAIGGANARRTLRADIEKLDSMLNLTGEIAITQGRLRKLVEGLDPEVSRELLEVHNEVERLYMGLQEQVMNIRMVPVGPLFRQFVRTVRDLSQGHGKQARLEVHGADVEIDTTVLEHLKDPILHMVRNAIDHGLENPEDRKAKGKEACGVITLSAEHSAGSILVKVRDDGAGFNRAKIAQKAKALGLIGDSEWIPEQQLYRLVFQAGFSTAEAVSDLSGRGVGMDVVQRNIDALRGSIDVQSEDGKGTTITIRLPLTLAIIEGFAVQCGGDTFIIPLDFVTECVELTQSVLADGNNILNLREQALPYLSLRDVFGCTGQRPARENVVVVQAGGLQAGIAVDALIGASQAVIKPLGKALQQIAGIAGSTILGDGRVGLILDVPGLLNTVMQSNPQPLARA